MSSFDVSNIASSMAGMNMHNVITSAEMPFTISYEVATGLAKENPEPNLTPKDRLGSMSLVGVVSAKRGDFPVYASILDSGDPTMGLIIAANNNFGKSDLYKLPKGFGLGYNQGYTPERWRSENSAANIEYYGIGSVEEWQGVSMTPGYRGRRIIERNAGDFGFYALAQRLQTPIPGMEDRGVLYHIPRVTTGRVLESDEVDFYIRKKDNDLEIRAANAENPISLYM